MRALNVPLLYAVQVAYAAEAWRTAHGAAVRSWLTAIGEIEALLSLSGYSYEHPADPFPEFVEGLPASSPNSSATPSSPRKNVFVMTSASAAKPASSSSAALTCPAKARSCAPSASTPSSPWQAPPYAPNDLQLTPLQIGASILINDSLQEGSSRFYAEITRLRQICDLAEKNPPVLFLLDELLQGTNSKDRLIGAEGVVRALLEAVPSASSAPTTSR